MRLDLLGGSYATRSPLGSTQRCINLFPEKPRPDGPDTWTMYETPGLRRLAIPPAAGPGRGVFRASQGEGYCVVGQSVYRIAPDWTLTRIGGLNVVSDKLCSMTDNGTTAVLVDSTDRGYEFAIADGSGFAQIVDPTGIFAGSIKVDYIDTFILWALLNSQQFGSTYSNVVQFDPTWTAAKTGYPDLLQTLFVNRHEILLLGQVKSEIWYDAGGSLFPFALLPGAYIEWGCLAPRSPAANDVNVYWLGQGTQGTGFVIKQRGYETKVVSNYALSYAIEKMLAEGIDISDAIAYTYSKDGHLFYVLTFQQGDQTWVYDESIADPELAWHQRTYVDSNGTHHRERPIAHAWLNNKHVVQDWQNGTLYELDSNYAFADVDEGDGKGPFARPIPRIRTFPQIKIADGPQGPMPLNGKSLMLNEFLVDFDVGKSDPAMFDNAGAISLRVSWDRGQTFANYVMASTGALGAYSTAPKWGNLGMGRWPVIEITWSGSGAGALNGGWFRGTVQQN